MWLSSYRGRSWRQKQVISEEGLRVLRTTLLQECAFFFAPVRTKVVQRESSVGANPSGWPPRGFNWHRYAQTSSHLDARARYWIPRMQKTKRTCRSEAALQ